MNSNKMVPFNYIIENIFNEKDVYIPLLQRNYKWGSKIVAKLTDNLQTAFLNNHTYTLGMITLYRETDDKMQLIDGQQRIITLYILLKYLSPEKDHYTFRFERDDGVIENKYKRQSYLRNIVSIDLSEEEMYTDLIRFRNNYNKIKEELANFKEDSEVEAGNYKSSNVDYANKFIEYIKNNVYFLLHISDAEPFNEFINMNKNKTRFVITDRIKANLILDSDGKEKRDQVLNVFANLSKILFANRDIWELVKQGYCKESIPDDNKREKNKHYPDENRLKLVCCERYGSDKYDVSSTLGYQYDNEVALLKNQLENLTILESDINENNWNSYNAFNCLVKLNNIIKDKDKNSLRFFDMIKNGDSKYLEEYLLKECDKIKNPLSQACYIESQLGNRKIGLDYIDTVNKISEEFNDKNQRNWLYNGDSEFEIFKQIYSVYINDKYKEGVTWK